MRRFVTLFASILILALATIMRRFVTLFASILILALATMPAFAWQTDTNSTTEPTQYTPAHPGDILIGYNGGVPSVWISYGQSSNEWADAAGTNTPITSARITDHTIAGADMGLNSVGGSNIVDHSVSAADLATDSVGGSNVVDHSIAGADLALDSVSGSNIVDGSVGLADLGTLASGTNFTFCTVAAGTAGAITNTMCITNGIWRINL